MCDCYYHKCERCDDYLPMHITDFCMPRDKIKVYCDKHIPPSDVVIFKSLGGATLPVDTPKNRELVTAINEVRAEIHRLREAHRELSAENEASRLEIVRLISRETKLVRQLEERLLTPDEKHLLLPGFFADDGAIWGSIEEELDEFPKGSRIGVQFLEAPPERYGLEDAVTPNLGVEYEVAIMGNPVVGPGRSEDAEK